MIFCDGVCFKNAYITLNYVEVCFDDVSWVFKHVYEIWEWEVIYEFYDELKIPWYICSKMTWKVYDVDWSINVWKHGYDDHMV